LDGDPGPFNGDGLACTQLPVDANRAASIPIDAFVAKAPPPKSALVDPDHDYYGLAEDGLPGDNPLLTTLDNTTGKAPSSLEWFDYWSEGYNTTKVQAAWAAGALPVITWMSESDLSSDPNAATYTLKNIVNGTFDSYLTKYAADVRALGLPVAIRLDQEMNGNWFPWSAGFAANQAPSGQPNYYVQAWRHIWNIFNGVGANDDVIWLWAPSRTDTIQPHVTTSGLKYETSLSEDYPGDQYVDWTGMSAYQYKPSDGWTYQATFGQTLAGLKALTNKPIFIAETGATEAVGSVDYAAEKAQWISQTLAGFLSDNSIVGFSYFNNTVNGVHKVDGVVIQTDWQFTTSPQAQAAFATGIADDRYSSGIMPDGTGG
jgi:mannan endo-1,4-beta-mannosidase